MSEVRRPLPSDEVLAEIAARHRITVKALKLEWEYASPYRPYKDIEAAAAAAYRSRKGIENMSKMFAENHMKRLKALSEQYGLGVMEIVAEKREGDWPDEESAAAHLAARRCKHPIEVIAKEQAEGDWPTFGAAARHLRKQRRPWWLRWLP